MELKAATAVAEGVMGRPPGSYRGGSQETSGVSWAKGIGIAVAAVTLYAFVQGYLIAPSVLRQAEADARRIVEASEMRSQAQSQQLGADIRGLRTEINGLRSDITTLVTQRK